MRMPATLLVLNIWTGIGRPTASVQMMKINRGKSKQTSGHGEWVERVKGLGEGVTVSHAMCWERKARLGRRDTQTTPTSLYMFV